MIDIDYFKRINDSSEHIFGDKVLRGIGQVLKANVKGKDTARVQSEEFAVLLPATPLQGAAGLAETLRTTIAGGRVKRLDSDETVGNINWCRSSLSCCPGESAVDFIGRADRAAPVSRRTATG
ncbi:MAG: GGDEF domain-containing protein [Comamonadaceae bacterium]|nr:GGDEF domain-containing protein [Comamonadaceae bacterium]